MKLLKNSAPRFGHGNSRTARSTPKFFSIFGFADLDYSFLNTFKEKIRQKIFQKCLVPPMGTKKTANRGVTPRGVNLEISFKFSHKRDRGCAPFLKLLQPTEYRESSNLNLTDIGPLLYSSNNN
jgi:hypothetical protein